MSITFSMMARPFYKSSTQCYIKVLIIDRAPDKTSNINKIVKQVKFDKLSPFDTNNRDNMCGFVMLNPVNLCEYATIDEIPIVFNWLIQNNYIIDTSITQMMNQGKVTMSNQLVCFITQQN